MGRRIMLPELAYRRGLPPAPGLRTWRAAGDQFPMVLLDVLGHGGSGALKAKPTGQLLANERVVQRFAERQKLLKKLLDRFGPQRFVIATGRLEPNDFFAREPLRTQVIKPGASNLQPLGGRLPVHLTLVKQLEDFGDQFRANTMN